jgi:hypothetical protein
MPRGRPTKFTPEVKKKIIDALSAGNYFEVACEYAGISVSLGMEWLQRGRGEHPSKPNSPQFVEFMEAVTRAQAEDEVHTIARLKKAGQGGDLIEETTFQEPSVIITHPDKRIEERIGKKRTVRRYSAPDTQPDEWRMERKHYQRWGRKERVDVNVTVRSAAEKIAAEEGMTAEEVLEEAQALLREIDHADA